MKSNLWKNAILGLSVVVLLGVWTGTAIAQDLCLQDSVGAFYVFTKFKSPKPGKTVALTGQHIVGAIQSPLSGSVTMNSAGTTVTAGIFIHGILTGNNVTANWTGDPGTLAGTGSVDFNGDYLPDIPLTFASVSCGSIVVP